MSLSFLRRTLQWNSKESVVNVRLVQGLLQRLEEETKMTSYIVTQKLPREIEQKQKEVDILSTVATEPVLARSNLDLLQAKVTHS